MGFEARCKDDGCRKLIVWARHEQSNKGVPLDPAPVADGNLIIVGRTGRDEPIVRFIGKDNATNLDRFVLHFATCPASKKFTRPKPKAPTDG